MQLDNTITLKLNGFLELARIFGKVNNLFAEFIFSPNFFKQVLFERL